MYECMEKFSNLCLINMVMTGIIAALPYFHSVNEKVRVKANKSDLMDFLIFCFMAETIT